MFRNVIWWIFPDGASCFLEQGLGIADSFGRDITSAEHLGNLLYAFIVGELAHVADRASLVSSFDTL